MKTHARSSAAARKVCRWITLRLGVVAALGLLGCRDNVVDPVRNAPSADTPAPSIAAVPNVTITDLGTLGGRSSIAVAINDAGQMAGWAQLADNATHAFRWTQATGMQDLGTLGGGYSEAVAINGAGVIVGVSETTTGESHAFRWTSAGGMEDLGAIGGTSTAVAINASGSVAGYAAGGRIAFRWTASDGMQDIGALGGSPLFAFPVGIDDQGQIAGKSLTSQGLFRAFLAPVGAPMQDLGSLSGSGGQSEATAISANGVVVGVSGYPGGRVRAFRATADKGMRELRLPGGFADCFATKVNARGLIGGYCIARPVRDYQNIAWVVWLPGGGVRVLPNTRGGPTAVSARNELVGNAPAAVYWSEATGVIPLGSLPAPFPGSSPSAINGNGQVVGNSYYDSNHVHAVLWTIR